MVLAGPTTILALMNSLYMGFRSLAIQKQSSEVWKTLGQVKTEFGRFETVLLAVDKKLHEASNKIKEVHTRSERMQAKLKDVEDPESLTLRCFTTETEPFQSLLTALFCILKSTMFIFIGRGTTAGTGMGVLRDQH